ncbi:peptidase M16 [Nitratireductor aestuarii]|uniref:Peptidase M16 n=1 Tax=Nitratireductor aestuarii TaxID=1735103 RepID=A0A916RVM4_9HYPH|nr:peptidase M16 [Nitratireductor aestuarii]
MRQFRSDNTFLSLLGALFIVLSLALPSSAEEAPKLDVDVFSLDNGLQVVVIPQRRVPIVTHLLAYKVGGADEPAGLSGMAHFFEHLMFKGTEKHPAGELDAAVQAVGGDHNAFTNHDSTVYYQRITPDALPQMMEFEADRMRNLILNDEVIETERQVVLEERLMRTDNDPGGILGEAFSATLYTNHPYGRPVIGWRHEIETVTREQLTDFYDSHYVPNNAILVVAGDVDTETVKKLAEETYGKVERGPDLPERVRPMEPPSRTERTVTLADDRVSIPSFSQAWLAPAAYSDERQFNDALAVLGEILGGSERSRLHRRLVIKERIAARVFAYLYGARDSARFVVGADPINAEALETVEAAIREELEAVIRDGVTAEELETAKKVYESAIIFQRENLMRRAVQYASDLIEGASVDELDDTRERLEAVTLENIQEAAKKYLLLDKSVKAYLRPAK